MDFEEAFQAAICKCNEISSLLRTRGVVVCQADGDFANIYPGPYQAQDRPDMILDWGLEAKCDMFQDPCPVATRCALILDRESDPDDETDVAHVNLAWNPQSNTWKALFHLHPRAESVHGRVLADAFALQPDQSKEFSEEEALRLICAMADLYVVLPLAEGFASDEGDEEMN